MRLAAFFDGDAGERHAGGFAPRARCGEQRRVAPVVNRDPLKQGGDGSGSIRLSRRAGLTQVRSFSVTADPNNRLAVPLAICPALGFGRVPRIALESDTKGSRGSSAPTRTSATRSAAKPSLQ